jgi:hypothetical protein
MKNKPSKGKAKKGIRYINLLRCSSLTQADTSPDGQKTVNDDFAQREGMIWADDIYLEGISGSQTFNRVDIDAIVERKKTRDDFDAIVIFDWARMTRGGSRHAFSVEDRLRKVGIQVFCSTDQIENGPDGDLMKAVKHYSNQLQARSISLGVARGLAQSLAKNERPSASRTPYGLDRLYRGPEGKPRMLTRWEGATQIWFRPDENGAPLDEIGRRVKPTKKTADAGGRRERFRGYVKQQDERSELVLGSEQRLEVVRKIFRLYDLDGWGYHRIANHLNGNSIPSPEGRRWTLTTVRNILRNPIYIGIEVRHRFSNALFHRLSENGPIPVSVDQDWLEREGFKQVPAEERPRDEWMLVDKPGLKEILPEDVRAKAISRITELFDPERKPHPKTGKQIHRGAEARHKHLNSPYILTGQLRSEQTGHTMRGETVNKKLKHGREIYRYYFDGSAAVFGERGLKAKRVRAEPIERAVLGVLSEVLSNLGDLDQRIRAAAKKSDGQEDGERRACLLREERENLVRRLREAYRLLGDMNDVLADQIADDKARIKAIDLEISKSERPLKKDSDVETIVRRVRKRMDGLAENLDNLPYAQIKQLLLTLVGDLRIDLETQELAIELILPASMLNDGQLETVRLDSKWPWPSEAEANRSGGLKIADYRCEHSRIKRQDCYTCSRVKRTA